MTKVEAKKASSKASRLRAKAERLDAKAEGLERRYHSPNITNNAAYKLKPRILSLRSEADSLRATAVMFESDALSYRG